MDESGGRGQPRSGNDESAERHAGRPPRATDRPSADERVPAERHVDDGRLEAGQPVAPQVHQPTGAPRPAGPAPAPADPAETEQHPPAPAPQQVAGGDPESPPAAPAPSPRTVPAGQQAPSSPPGAEGSANTPTPAPAPALGERATPDLPPPAGDAPGTHGPAGTPAPAADGGSRTPQDDARADAPHPAPGLRKTPGPRPDEGDAHPERAYAGGDHGGPGGRGPAPQRPEPRGGLLMGRPFGVPVYVAPSWFLVAALITWVFGGQLERVLPELGAARYLVSLFFAVAFYASVLVHELAHTVAALRFKLPVRRIQLQFFGGVSEIEKEAETPGREFVLAFVGPLLSLVLSGVFYAAMQVVEPDTVPGVLLAGLMISNLIVAAFNLLPGLPLDGGRMLRAVVWKLTGKPMTGTVAAAWVGRALAVSVLIGLPLLTQSGALGTEAVDNVGMDTVLDALLAAILAAIIWTGAGNSLRMARLREHLPELRARTLTRRAVPVEGDTPLSEALRRANAAGARALVVVDADGKPLSLVREAAIVGVPEHRRPWVAVSGLAQDLTDGMRVSAELSGEELLDALRATPATEYLVVEETGEIYGVLSAADVERAFVKAMARPS
ncbi:site-2 protease family protein [Streptomyces djakartensis]|uniref:site-2 protease family protein n=1 Tax=Streptomyces djakartensis TaxID=68193 RepID=UPI0034DE6534